MTTTLTLAEMIAAAVKFVTPYAKQFTILADLAVDAKEALDLIKETQAKTTYKKALKQIKREIVAATGLDPKRVSEAFVNLGHRERAPKQSSDKVTFDLEQLEVLMTLACDEFGEQAAQALREAAKEVVKASKDA